MIMRMLLLIWVSMLLISCKEEKQPIRSILSIKQFTKEKVVFNFFKISENFIDVNSIYLNSIVQINKTNNTHNYYCLINHSEEKGYLFKVVNQEFYRAFSLPAAENKQYRICVYKLDSIVSYYIYNHKTILVIEDTTKIKKKVYLNILNDTNIVPYPEFDKSHTSYNNQYVSKIYVRANYKDENEYYHKYNTTSIAGLFKWNKESMQGIPIEFTRPLKEYKNKELVANHYSFVVYHNKLLINSCILTDTIYEYDFLTHHTSKSIIQSDYKIVPIYYNADTCRDKIKSYYEVINQQGIIMDFGYITKKDLFYRILKIIKNKPINILQILDNQLTVVSELLIPKEYDIYASLIDDNLYFKKNDIKNKQITYEMLDIDRIRSNNQ